MERVDDPTALWYLFGTAQETANVVAVEGPYGSNVAEAWGDQASVPRAIPIISSGNYLRCFLASVLPCFHADST